MSLKVYKAFLSSFPQRDCLKIFIYKSLLSCLCGSTMQMIFRNFDSSYFTFVSAKFFFKESTRLQNFQIHESNHSRVWFWVQFEIDFYLQWRHREMFRKFWTLNCTLGRKDQTEHDLLHRYQQLWSFMIFFIQHNPWDIFNKWFEAPAMKFNLFPQDSHPV